jgi:hypothetical protein
MTPSTTPQGALRLASTSAENPPSTLLQKSSVSYTNPEDSMSQRGIHPPRYSTTNDDRKDILSRFETLGPRSRARLARSSEK